MCGLTDKKHNRSKHSASSGAAVYSVASVDNKLVNTPPQITSVSSVDIDEDQGFQFKLKATDPEDDRVAFLLNETAPATMGNVSLELNGLLNYTPCVDCYGEDVIYYTVWEQRLDDEPALSVEGQLVIKIRNLPDSPHIQLFVRGHNVIPPSSVVTVTMEENNRMGSVSSDMTYIIAAYDPDFTETGSLVDDQPQHGNLTLYRQITNVVLLQQDCSQPWDTRRPLWDKLAGIISSSATISQVALPNPCGTNLVTRQLAWVVTMFKYTPFEGYFGEEVLKVRHTLRGRQHWKESHYFLQIC